MTTFASPATQSESIKVADLNGHLLIVTPKEYREGITTVHGVADAIEVDLIDLDDNSEHTDVLFFNIALKSALKPNIGKLVLGRIGQGVAAPGKSAPWVLNAVTVQADIDRASAYLAAKASGASAPATAVAPAVAKAAVDVNSPEVQALLASLQAKPF